MAIDGVRLNQVSIGSPATLVLKYLSKMERNRGITTVDALQRGLKKDGTPLTRHQVIKVLQNLDKAGAGTFVVGRRGFPSRFQWAVPVTEFSKTAVKAIRGRLRNVPHKAAA